MHNDTDFFIQIDSDRYLAHDTAQKHLKRENINKIRMSHYDESVLSI